VPFAPQSEPRRQRRPVLEGESLPNATRLAFGYGESLPKGAYAEPSSTCQAESQRGMTPATFGAP